MSSQDIEDYVKNMYPEFDKDLLLIEGELINILDYYKKKHPELIEGGDFRPGIIGRLMASIINCRFFINNTLSYINSENWSDNFQKDYVPSPFKGNDYFGHFNGVDMTIRFNLFHSIYHNIETTLRIICKSLELNKRMHPMLKINKSTGCFPIEFIELISSIRNTIHNNGYYQPVGKQNKKIRYKDDEIEISFIENESVDLDTNEVIIIVNKFISLLKDLLLHDKISNIELILDKS